MEIMEVDKSNERKAEKLGHLAAAFTVSIWGTTFASTKVLLRSFQPVEVMFIRLCIAFLVLLVARPQKLQLKNKKEELTYAAAGLCGITLYYLFENTALFYTTAANVGVIISASPFFTALLSRFILKTEKPGMEFYFGFLAAITGIALISLNSKTSLAINPLGDFLTLAAAGSWAFYALLSKKISSYGYNIIQSTRKVFGYGILFLLPALYFFNFRPSSLAGILQPLNLVNILYLGVCASAVCFGTWNVAVKRLGPVKTTVYIYLSPVVTLITSVLVLGEVITGQMALGAALTLFGLILSEYKSLIKGSLVK